MKPLAAHALLALGLACSDAPAQVAPPEPDLPAWHFKLTPSVYSNRQAPNASDLNLRGNFGPHALWLGQYRQAGFGEQLRAGYEYTASPDWGQLVYSLQTAERGFAGGALTAQIGHAVYGIVGRAERICSLTTTSTLTPTTPSPWVLAAAGARANS